MPLAGADVSCHLSTSKCRGLANVQVRRLAQVGEDSRSWAVVYRNYILYFPVVLYRICPATNALTSTITP